MSEKKSLFVVIEGLDGSGKSTASRHLVDVLNRVQVGQVKQSYEPHDPSCGGLLIRDILTKKHTHFTPKLLPLAFATNRLDHGDQVIRPWLEAQNGNILICDRYYLSSLVYQSSPDFPFEKVMTLNEFALKPDIIFFINVDTEVCYARMANRNQAPELFEDRLDESRKKYIDAIGFLRKTRNENIIEIDGNGSVETVVAQLQAEIIKVAPHFTPPHLHQAQIKSDFTTAKSLFLEYAKWLKVDLCFQGFETELADIEVQYAAPKGGIFLLKIGGQTVGCVAIRPLKTDKSGAACELKRMYVRDEYRGKGYGKILLEAALDLARASGYKTMWLDTLDRLKTAIAVYKQYGFVETKPYYHNPLDSVRYFEKKL
ncbi:MAG: dTMP kinase [Saprospiraceae bacterium]|nr:dTMP kinase [Saprospiraceae bacterium]